MQRCVTTSTIGTLGTSAIRHIGNAKRATARIMGHGNIMKYTHRQYMVSHCKLASYHSMYTLYTLRIHLEDLKDGKKLRQFDRGEENTTLALRVSRHGLVTELGLEETAGHHDEAAERKRK